jgi:tol-pal system protein YbgF
MEKAHEDMSRQSAVMKTSLDEARAKLEELNNKFILLHEKLEATRAEVAGLQAQAAAGVPQLKVVSVGELGQAKEAGDALEKKPAQPEKAIEKADKPDKQAEAAARPSIGPEMLYNRAQDLFMAGNYAEARDMFSSFAASYPDNALADNALYWIGEAYYSEKDFENAVLKFREAADKYPSENKAPDALLKTAYSYIELNNVEKAKEFLDALIRRYPESAAAGAAKKAAERLSAKKGRGKNE